MALRCSACHHRFEVPESTARESTAARCPNCGAEAGLEPIERAALPMKLFGALLVVVVAVAIAGSVLGKIVV